MNKRVVTYYLQMLDPGRLHAPGGEPERLEVHRVARPSAELNRFFYAAVGADWYWVDRLGWSREQWQRCLDREGYETWTAWVEGAPAGYFELDAQDDGDVEIAYFGLLPSFVGHGFGTRLMAAAVRRAWAKNARRVWLHTCTLDHPGALDFYVLHGFEVYDEKVTWIDLPDTPPRYWPS